MVRVVGIRFRNSGKTYFFDPKDISLSKDDHVIVDTAGGIEYGYVVSPIQELDENRVVQPLRPVLRKASERDEEQMVANHAKEQEAFHVCQEKIREHKLDMKLTEAEYAFDNSKILFYFTAEGRVDFRELVKDLAGVFHTRIELRQIGVRDEAKALSGYGVCGRALCCATYLNDFVPVSIKMAKEQNLSLNPTKISGMCGRLMCCLKYEEETYEELNKTMPNTGDIVSTDDGCVGEVTSVDVLRQKAKVLIEIDDGKELRDYEASALTFIRKRKGKKGGIREQLDAADLEKLAALDIHDLPGEKRDHEPKQERPAKANQGEQKSGRGENGDNRAHSQENGGEERSGRNRNRNRNRGENNGEVPSENRQHENHQHENRQNNRNRDKDGRGKDRNDHNNRGDNRVENGENNGQNNGHNGGHNGGQNNGQSNGQNGGQGGGRNRNRHRNRNRGNGQNQEGNKQPNGNGHSTEGPREN